MCSIGRVVRSSHERYDGSGYPDGLAGDRIPIESRIVFCCDAWNAMTTDRPYRPALSFAEAIAELEAQAGSQFDPVVIAAMLERVRQGAPAGGASSPAAEPAAADSPRSLSGSTRVA
jgi:HD-GYP domain-containing protein (c-di-GMP phosphodiesterase class II)